MIRKANSNLLNELKSRFERQTIQLVALRKVVVGYDGDFWNSVKERLSAKRDIIQGAIDGNFLGMSEVDLKSLLAQLDILRYVINMPEDCKGALEILEKENSELREKIRGYSKRLSPKE